MKSIALAIRAALDVQILEEKNPFWAVPFIIYFFLTCTAFVLHMFLAITVHAYFEVDLLEGLDLKAPSWTWDQWKAWALWSFIYNRGRTDDTDEDEEEGDEDKDEEGDEEEEEG